jgi:phage shock protein E
MKPAYIHKLIMTLFFICFELVSCAQQKAESMLPEKFAAKMDSANGILLDVRTVKEFRNESIAGAVNMDFNSDSFASNIQQLDRNKSYFLYCASGNRSMKALKLMKENGFINIVNLEGGIHEWKKAGRPTSTLNEK